MSSQWQPIETCPEGERVLLAQEPSKTFGWIVVVGSLSNVLGQTALLLSSVEGPTSMNWPTHWAPIPILPGEVEETETEPRRVFIISAIDQEPTK